MEKDCGFSIDPLRPIETIRQVGGYLVNQIQERALTFMEAENGEIADFQRKEQHTP